MSERKEILITGGAGFIGCNLALRMLRQGHSVCVFDSLTRSGSDANLEWLRSEAKDTELQFIQGDIRNAAEVNQHAAGKDAIMHLAAQVAVTRSVNDPRHDFETNALGTLNVLEAARNQDRKPLMIYASTNKVYGDLQQIEIEESDLRYRFSSLRFGIDERQPLNFHSPYGCSKGAGDQYVRDYARIYSVPTVVFRMSCIYGPRQFGVEDQGWLVWFLICTILNKKINIFGNGKQVRDILHVDDLIDAFEKVLQSSKIVAGEVFNIGGGHECSISIWKELEPIIEEYAGAVPEISFFDWRPGDQKIYISDISKAKHMLGWEPKIGIREGVRDILAWVQENIDTLSLEN